MKKKLRLSITLFLVFFKISSFTVGGGAAMIPLTMDTVINKKKWMTEAEMLDCIAVSQSIPGAMIGNVATYVGRRVAGLPGAIFACIGTALPAFLVIIIVLFFWRRIAEYPRVIGFVKGALAGAAGMIAVSTFKLGRTAIRHIAEAVIALGAFAVVIFFGVNVVFVLLGGVALGFPVYIIRRRRAKRLTAGDPKHGPGPEHDPGDESDSDTDGGAKL